MALSTLVTLTQSTTVNADEKKSAEKEPDFKLTTKKGAQFGFTTNLAVPENNQPYTYRDLGVIEGTAGYSASHSSDGPSHPWKINLGLAIQNLLRSNGVNPNQLILKDTEWKFLDTKISLELAPNEAGSVAVDQYSVTIDPADVTVFDRGIVFNLGQIEISQRASLDGTFQVTTYPLRVKFGINGLDSSLKAVRVQDSPFEFSTTIAMLGYTYTDNPHSGGSGMAMADFDVAIAKSWALKNNQAIRLSAWVEGKGSWTSDNVISHEEVGTAITYTPVKNLSLRLSFKIESDQMQGDGDQIRDNYTQTGGLELISTY